VPHLLEPGDRGRDRLRIDVAAVNAAVALANEQTRIFEHANMFRDRRQRHLERFGELADGALAGRQSGQHGATRRIGQS